MRKTSTVVLDANDESPTMLIASYNEIIERNPSGKEWNVGRNEIGVELEDFIIDSGAVCLNRSLVTFDGLNGLEKIVGKKEAEKMIERAYEICQERILENL